MKKILIADDDKAIRLLYADELKDEGYDVTTLGDASRLLEVIEKYKHDIIVLDIRLGEYDGLDLLQCIRDINYNIPVILCTAYSNFKCDIRPMASVYYLVKSSNLEELKLLISRAIEGRTQFPEETERGYLQQMHST